MEAAISTAKPHPVIPASFTAGPKWMILRTIPQREKRAARVIARDGFEVFLPIERKTVRQGNKRVVSEQPLIPSYVFPRFDPSRLPDLDKEDWQWAGVESLLMYAGSDNVPHILPDGVMEDLVSEANRGAFDLTRKGVKGTIESMTRAGLKLGGRLRLVDGVWSGLSARILEARPQDRLAVLFDGSSVKGVVTLAQVRAF